MIAFLLADGNWVTFIVPAVIAIIYLIQHLLGAAKGSQPPPRNKPQRRPIEPAERPGRPGPKRAAQQPVNPQLSAEIEQFLKRARREPVQAPPTPPPAKPARREAAREGRLTQRGDVSSVAASVEKHLDNRGFAQRTEHLADDIVRADKQMEDHLQQAFNRRVGTLGDVSDKPPTTPVTDAVPVPTALGPPAGQALGSMLATAQNIKQAVILQEILQRPEHRW